MLYSPKQYVCFHDTSTQLTLPKRKKKWIVHTSLYQLHQHTIFLSNSYFRFRPGVAKDFSKPSADVAFKVAYEFPSLKGVKNTFWYSFKVVSKLFAILLKKKSC